MSGFGGELVLQEGARVVRLGEGGFENVALRSLSLDDGWHPPAWTREEIRALESWGDIGRCLISVPEGIDFPDIN